jgi:hypothetical protein
MRRAALGLRTHSGWAVMVAVCGPATNPTVVLRKRLELIDAEMQIDAAAAFLERCAGASNWLARAAFAEALADLAGRGYAPAGCGLLLSAGRPTKDLAAILASHPAIHTAEGEFYRNVLRLAAESYSLKVSGFSERDLSQDQDRLRRASELGKTVGPPWRQDEKLATLAGWRLLEGG